MSRKATHKASIDSTLPEKQVRDNWDISNDLTWIDMLKGIAMIGVFYDNWTLYMIFAKEPAWLYSLITTAFVTGPFVQVFFILSGFGLTFAYLNQKEGWNWKKWIWRRFTKIVLPYQIFVIITFILAMIGTVFYESVNREFSWAVFLSYVTFTRNFYPPSFGWNVPLWYMPIVIGLYIIFPLFILILEKWGHWMLLLVSAILTFTTITITATVGLSGSHAYDFFTQWTIQFAMGMALAKIHHRNPQNLQILIGIWPFLLGFGLYLASWMLRTFVPLGSLFNDPITSVGIFLLLLNFGWAFRNRFPIVNNWLFKISSASYFMYLLHWPVLAYLLGPPFRVPTNPLIIVLVCPIFMAIIYLLVQVIAPPINNFTAWAYGKYQPKALPATTA